jgi:hypothetical protein
MRDINSIQKGERFDINPVALKEMEAAAKSTGDSVYNAQARHYEKVINPVMVIYRWREPDHEGDLGITVKDSVNEEFGAIIRPNWTRYFGWAVSPTALTQPFLVSPGDTTVSQQDSPAPLWDSVLYCQCKSPITATNHALGKAFNYCRGCRKERRSDAI